MENMFSLNGVRLPTSTSPVPSAHAETVEPRVKCADDLDRIPRSTVRSCADLCRSGHRHSRRVLRRRSGQAAAADVVNVAKAKTLYPQDTTPPAAPAGMAWVPVRINRVPGQYDQFNQANTWHATRFFGPEPACRLSITEDVGNTLLIEPR